MPDIFSPTTLGAIRLSNHIVMAPMTRDRAGPQDEPTDIMVEYYRQRATAGLIITEGVQPSPAGKGYWRTPGIHSDVQTFGWKKVNDAVTARGGAMVMQIMHVGRASVRDQGQPDRFEVLGPDFHRKVRALYHALAQEEPARFFVVDAARPPEAVEEEIWHEIARRFR